MKNMIVVLIAVVALAGMTQADVITRYNFNQDPGSKDPTTQIDNTTSTAIGAWSLTAGSGADGDREGKSAYEDTWLVRSTAANDTAWADFTVTVGSGCQMTVTSFEIDVIDGPNDNLERRLPEALSISYNTGSGWTALGSEVTFPQTGSAGTYNFTPESPITGLTGDIQFRMTFFVTETSYTYIIHDNVTLNGTIGDTAGGAANKTASDMANGTIGDTAGDMAGDMADDTTGDMASDMADDTTGDVVNDMANDTTSDMVNDTASGTANDTIVPDPKTVGILGLGALVSLLFRRIRD